ncbi:MAG: hypothetical protein HY529_01630 [Chloroflexi bacterium]|nr:hypothetical protein [Chloroflexota bacterium]
MKAISPLKLIFLGAALILGGFLLLLFMVIRLISPSFILSFLAYALYSVGLIVGLIGIIWQRRS